MSMLCTNNYEEISASLLDLSPTLKTATVHPEAFVKHTTIHNQLIELNNVHNSLLLLITEELLNWHLNIKIPSPTGLPSIYTLKEFVTERDRLFDAISEYDDLYLHLVHARKSHEEDWPIKFNVKLH